MNRIASLLPSRRWPAFVPPPAPAPTRPAAAGVDDRNADAGDALCGCGWYDSSNDLRVGLVVQEHETVDPISADLPLSEWIALELQGWRS